MLPGCFIQGMSSPYSLCFFSCAKKGVGLSVEHEVEATYPDGQSDEIEGTFVLDAPGDTMPAK